MPFKPPVLPERTPIREYLVEAISDAIVRQEFAPGQRLKDAALAKQLGASRTPTREALLQLVDRGYLQAEPGYGFTVAPMSRREAEDVYEVLELLELFAIERSDPCSPEQAAALHALIASARSSDIEPIDVIRLDMEWHKALLRGFPNQKLHATLDNLRKVSLRYDAAYFLNQSWTDTSFDEHEAITRAFAAGERDRATELLARHWRRSVDDLIEGLFNTPEEHNDD